MGIWVVMDVRGMEDTNVATRGMVVVEGARNMGTDVMDMGMDVDVNMDMDMDMDNMGGAFHAIEL